jgi:hypothetical protein
MRASTTLSTSGRMGAPPPLPVPSMPGSESEFGGRDIESNGTSLDLELVDVVCEDRGDGEDTTGPAIEA